MTTEEIQTELACARELLAAVQDAIKSVLCGGQSYSLDSGQTRQSVTRSTLGELRKMRRELKDEIDALETQLSGAGFYGRTAF